MLRRTFVACIVCAIPMAGSAGVIAIPGGSIDVIDVSRFAAGVTVRDRYHDVTEPSRYPVGVDGRPDLCGMRVVARSRSSGGDAVEWNLLFSIVSDGQRRIGTVSAGSFTRAASGVSAVPRRAIAQLAFAVDAPGGAGTAVARDARLAGDGVAALLPEPFVEEIWNALDTGTPIRVELTFDSGTQETLKLRALGSPGLRWFHGRRNSRAMLCLGELAPASGPDGPLQERDHRW